MVASRELSRHRQAKVKASAIEPFEIDRLFPAQVSIPCCRFGEQRAHAEVPLGPYGLHRFYVRFTQPRL